ncbi:MAG: aldehyde dehydrogenase family protein [Caulobacteraceae bacterium]
MQPTVLAETNRNMKVVREEIFGPVVCAMPINDEDLDNIARTANDTTYGPRRLHLDPRHGRGPQAGQEAAGGHGVGERLGGIDPAVPFGGFKQSGWGRENGLEGAEHFYETKTVSIAL